MKAFTFIGFVVIITLAVDNVKAFSEAEQNKIANKLIMMGIQCAMLHPLTLSDFKAFQKKTIPDGENPKCFVACMFKKVGVMDSMGLLSPAGVLKYGKSIFEGNEEYLKIIDGITKSCSAVNQLGIGDADKGCERAKPAFTCLFENASKYGFGFDLGGNRTEHL